ncbi:multicopper oxidase family protein [Paenarthrobacter aurescens]|uniref:multicopper oxidase family protein n=1 Tax=Paenarthrobacter aurescens TaxID=43663 RepID=UPI0021BF0B0D|nr:multicopper oxidase family protein [Paenarthrobacter aurescens]
MQAISRRQALLLGGFGVAATAAGSAGLLWTLTSRQNPVTGRELTQPPEERSANGQLRVRLEAAPGQMLLAGQQAAALGYNGGVPGPTFRVQPGDVLRIGLVNNLAQATNLHVHGLHVSPEGSGDNVFVSVDPGDTFDYEYKLSVDHPPGVYWYHPHHHGMVADQIFAGLFGAIIVEDPVPIEASVERVLVISDTTLDSLGNIAAIPEMERMMGREGELILVNGQSNPQFSARPGQRERWRIINACVARYLRLRLDGQQLQLIGVDSGRFPTPKTLAELLLIPGNRADLLVTTATGGSVLRAFYQDRGTMEGMMRPGRGTRSPADQSDGTALATLHVTGEPVASLPSVPFQKVAEDLRAAPVAARRQILLSTGMTMGRGSMSFTINGKKFDETRTDTTVSAGGVEEWTLTNAGPMDHPFHLHVWPMQIVEENGHDNDQVIWQDVVNVPANGHVKVRIAFKDFSGRSVYHCHILDHEDLGMMGAIEVR